MQRNGFLSALGALCAAGSPRVALAAAPPVTIRAAATLDDDATPFIWATENGLFRRNGIDASITRGTSGAAIAAGVIGGAYEIGKSSITTLCAAHARGVPLTWIAPAGEYDSSMTMRLAMIVKSDSPIKTGADLNGKTFGVYGIGDIYTISARAWMEKNGGDPNSLKFVELPISAMVEAIATGRVDAGAMNEPAVEVALTSPRLRLLSHPFASVAPRFLYTAWFAATEYAAAHRPAMDAFGRSMREAAAYVNGHHEQTVDMISTFTSVDAATIRKMTRVEQGVVPDPKLVQPVIDEMAKSKAIPTAFDARELFLR
jgi:ABC-type nitrate/sulfonate/bicarbonate transport system substrate-binding protein